MNNLLKRLSLLEPSKRARLLAQLPPLSFAQQRLWFIDEFEGGSAFYNLCAAVQLEGSLDYQALKRTFNEIVRRHESLRTSFASIDGQPVQFVNAVASLPLPLLDLSSLDHDARDAELQRLRRDEAQHPFDLSLAPLIRLSLVRLSPDQHVALVTMHHIVSDGWSIGVLVKEVATLYDAYTNGKESPLEELPIQYADYAAWQRERLQGDALEQVLSYWRRQLGRNLMSLELPTDRPRPAVQSYRGGHVEFALSVELTGVLRELARREGATLFMVLLAAFQTLLQRYSGQEDIVVGTPVAGRDRAETEGLIGFFVNTLVLRGDLSGDPAFVELLRRVREVTLESYAHQEVPFEKLVEELQPQRSLSHSPLFQVMLVLQNTPSESLQLPGLTLTALPANHFAALFDLLLSLTEIDGAINGSLQYKHDLFDASTAERMALHFQTLLTGIAADPQQRISRLPLLSEEERRQQLDLWNASHDERVEDLVAIVWEEFLGRDEVLEDPQVAEQLMNRVREVFGVELEVSVPVTLMSLSTLIEERMLEEVSSSLP